MRYDTNIVLLRLVRRGEHHSGIALVAIGDPGLGAVEHPLIAVKHRRGRSRAGITAPSYMGGEYQWGFNADESDEYVAPAVAGFREGEAAQLLARGKRGNPLLFLIRVSELLNGATVQRLVV